MKRGFLLLALLLGFQLVFSQIYDPVSWSFTTEQVNEKQQKLIFKAVIEKGWHLYSQNLPSDEGPIPTAFIFQKTAGAELKGKVIEPKPKVEYDPNFDMDLGYFEKEVIFTQLVELTSSTAEIEGELEFMVCNEKMCLPPEYIPFTFSLKAANKPKTETSTKTENPVKEKEKLAEDPVKVAGDEPKIFDPVSWEFTLGKDDTVRMVATIAEGWHLYSTELPSDDGPIATEINFEENLDFKLIGELVIDGEVHTAYDENFLMDLSYFEEKVVFKQKVVGLKEGAEVTGNTYYMACNDVRCITPQTEEFTLVYQNTPLTESEEVIEDQEAEDKSVAGIFIAGFLGGLLALLTPCVFPMIPLTVSFFTKQSKTKAKGISNALIYGASIIGIYVLLGLGITIFFGSDALNALSTNFWFNIIFFILFVVFAISFFGAFEITLPSSWVNKADSASDKGGLIGIFFMAFTLSLVSFSCTGPIIGTLLVEAAVNGGVQGPLVGMFGFSSALALPFGLFAAFPGWLNSLPKSGGWLNSVKVVLGFLELALALKFLSNADLVVQAGILTRELFIAIWIAIFALLTLYLLGFITLPHDTKVERLPIPRLLFAIVSLIFTVYLIPGLWGAPLKVISGFPPPMFYSESPDGVGKAGAVIASNHGGEKANGDANLHCPHNLNCFHDYEAGLAYAKEVNKPVMLDFTGWACVNCRKMEEQVWSDPRVLEILSNDVVLISLYVDEKTELPKEEQIEVKIGEKTKTLRTVGNKWSYFQASRYKTNSQPHYVMLDHKENQLHEAAAYDPDIPKFIDWLERGIKKFKKQS